MTALVLALLALATPAAAQQNPEATRLFREGVAALRADDFARAADSFVASYRLEARVTTICNLALTFDRWGDHAADAVQAYDQCARDDESGRFRPHAVERAAALRTELAAGTPAPPPPDGTPPPSPFSSGPRDDTPPPHSSGPALTAWGTPIETPGQPAPERSHGLLWGGVASAGLAAVSFAIGLYLIADAGTDEDYLARTYDDGRIPIPRGSDDAALLDAADTEAGTGVILYIVSGVLAALGTTLIVLDLTAPDGTEQTPYRAHLDLTADGARAGATFAF